jgi:dihydrofolate reductase
MATSEPTITFHVVASLDGFIARNDNSISWMDTPSDVYEKGVTEADSDRSIKIDCFVLGSLTYEHALQLGWPYGDIPTIVLTSRDLKSTRKTVEFYSGDPKTFVETVLAPRFAHVWLVGGAIVGQRFLALDLVDEIRLTIAPVLLGQGLRLFSDSAAETKWRLTDLVGYKNCYVAMTYARATPERPGT